VIAMVFLGESLGAVQAVGIALVCAATPVIALGPRASEPVGRRIVIPDTLHATGEEEHEAPSRTECCR
jgi:hypothetical protein